MDRASSLSAGSRRCACVSAVALRQRLEPALADLVGEIHGQPWRWVLTAAQEEVVARAVDALPAWLAAPMALHSNPADARVVDADGALTGLIDLGGACLPSSQQNQNCRSASVEGYRCFVGFGLTWHNPTCSVLAEVPEIAVALWVSGASRRQLRRSTAMAVMPVATAELSRQTQSSADRAPSFVLLG
jgi:hypothetical protein